MLLLKAMYSEIAKLRDTKSLRLTEIVGILKESITSVWDSVVVILDNLLVQIFVRCKRHPRYFAFSLDLIISFVCFVLFC